MRTALWGLLAIAPVVVLSYVSLGTALDRDFAPPLAGAETTWGNYWWAITGGAITAIWILFLINVRFNRNVPNDKRALWTALMFFGAIWVMPFYWWFYLRERA